MIWYCQKLFFPKFSFFLFFPPLIFFPILKPFDSRPTPHWEGGKLNYIPAIVSFLSLPFISPFPVFVAQAPFHLAQIVNIRKPLTRKKGFCNFFSELDMHDMHEMRDNHGQKKIVHSLFLP